MKTLNRSRKKPKTNVIFSCYNCQYKSKKRNKMEMHVYSTHPDENLPVKWEKMNSTRSSENGLLATHGRFLYHKDSVGRKGTRTYFTCSHKKGGVSKGGCPGTAVILSKMVDNGNGKITTFSPGRLWAI